MAVNNELIRARTIDVQSGSRLCQEVHSSLWTHSYENGLEGMDETRRVPRQTDTHMPWAFVLPNSKEGANLMQINKGLDRVNGQMASRR